MKTPPPDFSAPDDAIDDLAATWLCERAEGFSPERARAFAAWCAADPRHAAAVRRTEQALALLDEMPEVSTELQARVSPPRAAVVRFPRWQRAAWAVGLAAAIAVVAIWWPAHDVPPALEQRIVTQAGGQRVVPLEDGSVLDVNANSDLRVRLTERERRVELASGEAHFEVAHDATRPFIVTAAGVSVRAVGTAFNVVIAPEGVEVVVTEGRVAVMREAREDSAKASEPLVSAGERAWVPSAAPGAEPRVEKLDAARLQAAVAWRSRPETFAGVPLHDVVDRLNRTNRTQIVIADPELADRRVGGVFAADQVEAFVRLLEQDGDIAVDRSDGQRIVLRRR